LQTILKRSGKKKRIKKDWKDNGGMNKKKGQDILMKGKNSCDHRNSASEVKNVKNIKVPEGREGKDKDNKIR